jgi:plastocyanin
MVLYTSYNDSNNLLRKLFYIVFAFVLILSIGLMTHSDRTSLLYPQYIMQTPRRSQYISPVRRHKWIMHSRRLEWYHFKPNPTITVAQGDMVSIALSCSDGIIHEFQLELDNDGGESADCRTTDPCSSPFPPSTTFTFTVAASPGTYTYYCTSHTTQMHGTFTVNPSTTVGGVAAPLANPLMFAAFIALASTALVAATLPSISNTRGPTIPTTDRIISGSKRTDLGSTPRPLRPQRKLAQPVIWSSLVIATTVFRIFWVRRKKGTVEDSCSV